MIGQLLTMKGVRVNEIDLLRFFAALAVVFFHYGFRGYAADAMTTMPYPLLAPYAKYGYFGVQLFFMISGFVILMTAANGSLRGFVVSRLVRLYPAFWASCTITFLAILVIGKPRYSAELTQYLVNMTMLSGFLGVPSISGVYWTLFVEMQFYALVALILFFGRIHQAQTYLILWLLISVGLEVLRQNRIFWFVVQVLPMEQLRYVFIANYSTYFIAGSLYFLIWSQGLSAMRVAGVVVCWGLALFQSNHGLRFFEADYHTAMSRPAVAGIVTGLFLIMLLVSLRKTGLIGRRRWMLFGALTYPLYLIHETIGFMIFNALYPAVNAHLLLWGTLLFILAAAYAIHIRVEKLLSTPFRNAINRGIDAMQGMSRSKAQP